MMIKRLATRKIWKFPVWVYVLAAVVIAGALGGGGDADQAGSVDGDPEPTAAPEIASEQPVTAGDQAQQEASSELPAFASRTWESRIDEIVASDDSPIGKGDAVDALAREYSMTSADVAEQFNYLLDQVQTRQVVDRAADKVFMFRLLFVARAVDRAMDDAEMLAEDAFAFDTYQIARDLARDTEAPDSDFIQANLDQLDAAIAENGWTVAAAANGFGLACVPVPAEVLDAIASGLTAGPGASLSNGHALMIPPEKQNSAGFPGYFVTALIEADGLSDDSFGVWAVGDLDGISIGSIWALDGFAIEFSDWLSAAEDGSQADQSRDLLASYDERFDIADCR